MTLGSVIFMAGACAAHRGRRWRRAARHLGPAARRQRLCLAVAGIGAAIRGIGALHAVRRAADRSPEVAPRPCLLWQLSDCGEFVVGARRGRPGAARAGPARAVEPGNAVGRPAGAEGLHACIASRCRDDPARDHRRHRCGEAERRHGVLHLECRGHGRRGGCGAGTRSRARRALPRAARRAGQQGVSQDRCAGAAARGRHPARSRR